MHHMERLEKYSITVVIPTRNSMPELEAHVHALNEWLHRVGQVIVVDSDSSDGTLEYLQENLKHECVEFLNHPPGLYESWNAAIKRAGSKYTYIATVNDYMPWETLVRLYSEAERLAADVVVSAPEIVYEDSTSKHRKWPIHSFLEKSVPKETYLFQPLELLAWNSIDLPGTLIGSSASNLYRSVALQENPFPYDYGHAGDSAWAVAQALSLRWAFVPDVASNFQCHAGKGSGRGQGRRLRAQLYALSCRQFECAEGELATAGVEAEILSALRYLFRLWERKEQAVSGYQAYRKRRVPWVIFPRAWMLRSSKNRADLEIRHQVEVVLAKTGDLYCYEQ
jgi:hypothetical protein